MSFSLAFVLSLGLQTQPQIPEPAPAPELPHALVNLLRDAAQSENEDDLSDAVRLLEIRYASATIQNALAQIQAEPSPQSHAPLLTLEEEANPCLPEQESEAEAIIETVERDYGPVLNQVHWAANTLMNGESDVWTGRVKFGFRTDSGNTERTDSHIGLEVERELMGWGFEGKVNYARSETNDVIGRDEFRVQLRGETEWGENWTLFGATDYERDNKSSYDTTLFVGAGAGYRISDSERLKWTLRAAPGQRFQNTQDGEDTNVFAVDIGSDLQWAVTETVRFKSESTVLMTDQSRADQTFTLYTELGSLWALELKYRYRHEFQPEDGFKAGDSRADFSLVREF